jgi:hypothetical protein
MIFIDIWQTAVGAESQCVVTYVSLMLDDGPLPTGTPLRIIGQTFSRSAGKIDHFTGDFQKLQVEIGHFKKNGLFLLKKLHFFKITCEMIISTNQNDQLIWNIRQKFPMIAGENNCFMGNSLKSWVKIGRFPYFVSIFFFYYYKIF